LEHFLLVNLYDMGRLMEVREQQLTRKASSLLDGIYSATLSEREYKKFAKNNLQ